jgi:hypothetical protein
MMSEDKPLKEMLKGLKWYTVTVTATVAVEGDYEMYTPDWGQPRNAVGFKTSDGKKIYRPLLMWEEEDTDKTDDGFDGWRDMTEWEAAQIGIEATEIDSRRVEFIEDDDE